MGSHPNGMWYTRVAGRQTITDKNRSQTTVEAIQKSAHQVGGTLADLMEMTHLPVRQ